MDSNKIISFVGFIMVMVPFGMGLSGTLSGAPEVVAEEPTVAVATPVALGKPDYIAYPQMTVSIPQFDRKVAVGLSFMVDQGTPIAESLWEAIGNRDGRLDAVVTQAIEESGLQARDTQELRRLIPTMVRHSVNLQVGTDENPSPVREVLITSYAMQ